MLEQGALPSEAGTSSPMLRRLEYRRFGHTGVYRDVTFALLFGLQLVCVLTIAVVNGGRVHASPAGSLPPPPPPLGALEPPASASRLSAEMLLILAVASGVAALLSALWLVMLQTGARSLIWSGAALATALALANAAWLFSLGGAAGTALGLASFCLCLGSVAYLLYHRSFLDFSACLLSAVAHVLRAYPATLALAAAAAAAAMLYAVLWSAALAATAQLPRQAAASSLLLLSFFWTLQTIKAVVHATVAGTVASWYFLSPHVPPSPTKRAVRRALTTSFGSLCLGALLASSLQTTRVLSRVASRHAPCGAGVRSGCLCVLGFVDVLLRFCNEYAYTQVALYGKTFTRASRDTWTLLAYQSGVEALLQRDLVASALSLGCAAGGLACAALCGMWGRAAFGAGSALWWQAQLAGFAIGYAALSVVGTTVQAGVAALYVCYAEDPTPLASIAPSLYATFIAQPHVPTGGEAERPPTSLGGSVGGGWNSGFFGSFHCMASPADTVAMSPAASSLPASQFSITGASPLGGGAGEAAAKARALEAADEDSLSRPLTATQEF